MTIQFTKTALILSSTALLIGAFFVSGSTFSSDEKQTAPSRTVKTELTTDNTISSTALSQDHFVAMGDWGTGTVFQKAVAKQLARQYQKKPFSMVLMLGDNIYPVGNIRKFAKPYFETMYQPLLSSGVQFIVALGNHDVVAGHGDEQVRYFKMPGRYYEVSQHYTHFFIIDTNTFAEDTIQQKWLLKSLERAKAPWKIVMAHHPIYSSGDHGVNTALQETLEPILKAGKAQFYLAGHDHDYERFSAMDGVVHIVSGGGGAYLRDFKEPPVQHSVSRIKKHHFLDFEASATHLQFNAIDAQGMPIDTFSWSAESTVNAAHAKAQ
jgi:hypothetical protein